jgi:hypothetical protein
MLKKASDTLVFLGKSRVIAALGRVGLWTLVIISSASPLLGSCISHAVRPFAMFVA